MNWAVVRDLLRLGVVFARSPWRVVEAERYTDQNMRAQAQGQDVRRNPKGDPHLLGSLGQERPAAHTANGWSEGGRNLRQPWERRSVLVVSVKSPRTDNTSLQVLAPSDLAGKPVQII